MRLALLCLPITLPGFVHADEPSGPIAEAVRSGLSLVQGAGERYPTHRRCFSCHHQTMPLLAVAEAKRAGLPVDDDFVAEQIAFTERSFRNSRERLRTGRHIGGRAATVTYALWTYDLADVEPNGLTADFVEYLLRNQDDDGSWSPPSQRPPFMQSRATLAVLALLAFERYGTKEQEERISEAERAARAYLDGFQPVTQEDANALLWADVAFGLDDDARDAALEAVLDGQHDDGGFSQHRGRSPDAYATGQTIWVLRYAGVPADDPAIRRAVSFLLETRESDGSWFVKTRVKPVQVYFDNGDPHDRDQFLSTPATAWAVAGLASLLE